MADSDKRHLRSVGPGEVPDAETYVHAELGAILEDTHAVQVIAHAITNPLDFVDTQITDLHKGAVSKTVSTLDTYIEQRIRRLGESIRQSFAPGEKTDGGGSDADTPTVELLEQLPEAIREDKVAGVEVDWQAILEGIDPDE